jgi:RNA polymerase sigma-70 factor, ECF subfamily
VSFSDARGRDIERLDDALTALAAFDGRKAEIIELRYFGGFGLEEIGQSLSISAATVCREQRMAEAWLYCEIALATERGV